MERQSDDSLESRKVAKWLGHGVWSIGDQAFFSGANFVMAVVLARWLSPVAYGVFTIALTVRLFLRTLHTALIIEPMLVYGPSERFGSFSSYMQRVSAGHLVCVLGLAIMGLVVGLIVLMVDERVGQGIAVAAILIPAQFSVVFARRRHYARGTPRGASVISGVYCALVLGGVFFLHFIGRLSVSTAFLAQGVGAGAATLLTMFGGAEQLKAEELFSTAKGVFRHHWPFARWLLGSLLSGWAILEIWYLIAPLSGGVDASGRLRAHLNFLKPVSQSSIALSALAVPPFAKLPSRKARSRLLRRCLVPAVLLAVGYGTLVVGFGEEAMEVVYSGRFETDTVLLLVAAVGGLAEITARLLEVACKSTGMTKPLFKADLFTALFGCIAGAGLAVLYAMKGLALAIVLTYLAWIVTRSIARRNTERQLS